MASLIVGPMLRHVGHTWATIFLEADAACAVEINERRTRTFCVAGHHYALVMLEHLTPGSVIDYDVRLDDQVCWPEPGGPFPPSCIRTLDDGPLRLLFGSCRSAAPHEPPWSLSPTEDPHGRGVDALRARGLRMLREPIESWPHLLLLVGDQVYADDTSPAARERIEQARSAQDDPPSSLAGDFEQYTWLYHESWRSPVERWVFSVVPSAMIFDDHEMIDDWNISASWVRHIRRQPWWEAHVIGGLISYWLYQHLGNMSPDEVRADGMLDRLMGADDGYPLLRDWALETEKFTPVRGGYQFSFARSLGRTLLVVLDCRNGRVLEPDRLMLDEGEWEWAVAQCHADVDHLLLATSLPVFVPGSLHDLQRWNAAVCDGAWTRLASRAGEALRRAADLEDWPAFGTSFDRFTTLLTEVATGTGGSAGVPVPETITVLSGDIHFTYVARVLAADGVELSSRIHQVVSSPIRNALARRDRAVIRLALSRAGCTIGRWLCRSARLPSPEFRWPLTHGPQFANAMAMLHIDGRAIELVCEQARHGDDGEAVLEETVRVAL